MSKKIQITYGKVPGSDVYTQAKWQARVGLTLGTGNSVETALYNLVEKLVEKAQ